MAENLIVIIDRIESDFAVCEILNDNKSVNVPLMIFNSPPKEGSVYYASNILNVEQFVKALADKLQIELLYDENLNIMSLNPPMDYDHAFTGDGNTLCLPMQMFGQTVTQEEVAIDIIKEHPDWIDFDVDLSEYKYGSEVTKRLAVLREYVIEKELESEISIDGDNGFEPGEN